MQAGLLNEFVDACEDLNEEDEAEIEKFGLQNAIRTLNKEFYEERRRWRHEKLLLEGELMLQTSRNGPAPAAAVQNDLGERLQHLEAEAAKWYAERKNLQHQIMALSRSQGPANASLAALEEERWALQEELSQLKMCMRECVVIPRSLHHSKCQPTPGSDSYDGKSAVGKMDACTNTDPGMPWSKDLQAAKPGPDFSEKPILTNTSDAIKAALAESGAGARLEREVTRLAAELFIVKDECVPVPKAEHAVLAAVHSEKAQLETQLRAIKGENHCLQRKLTMLTEEMDFIKDNHVALTLQEYTSLKDAAAGKGNLVPARDAPNDLLALRIALKEKEAAAATATQEQAHLELRLRSQEKELEAVQHQLKDALEINRLATELLGREKDTASSQRQQLSNYARERGDLEMRALVARQDRDAVVCDLVEAKLELARMRELEVLYKRALVPPYTKK